MLLNHKTRPAPQFACAAPQPSYTMSLVLGNRALLMGLVTRINRGWPTSGMILIADSVDQGSHAVGRRTDLLTRHLEAELGIIYVRDCWLGGVPYSQF